MSWPILSLVEDLRPERGCRRGRVQGGFERFGMCFAVVRWERGGVTSTPVRFLRRVTAKSRRMSERRLRRNALRRQRNFARSVEVLNG